MGVEAEQGKDKPHEVDPNELLIRALENEHQAGSPEARTNVPTEVVRHSSCGGDNETCVSSVTDAVRDADLFVESMYPTLQDVLEEEETESSDLLPVAFNNEAAQQDLQNQEVSVTKAGMEKMEYAASGEVHNNQVQVNFATAQPSSIESEEEQILLKDDANSAGGKAREVHGKVMDGNKDIKDKTVSQTGIEKTKGEKSVDPNDPAVNNPPGVDAYQAAVAEVPPLPLFTRNPGQQQPTRPGAYGQSGANLQRNTTLDYAIVGANENENANGVAGQPNPGAFAVEGIGGSRQQAGGGVAENPPWDITGSANFTTSEQLAVANPVAEDPEAPSDMMRAVEFNDEKAARARRRKTKQMAARLLGGGLLLIAIVVGVVVLVVSRDGTEGASTSTSTHAPSPSPTPAPTVLTQRGYIQSLLPGYSVDAILQSPNSSQALAFEWLLEDPNLERIAGSYRLFQRFALATLYYATGGSSWVRNDNWLSYTVHECRWHSAHTYYGKPKESYGNAYAYNDTRIILSDDYPCKRFDPEDDSAGTYEHVWLMHNALAGSIPMELYLLTSLKTLSLTGNTLSGTISTLVGMLTNMEAWETSSLALTGTLPTEIGLLTKLEEISLMYNQFSGTVPSTLGLLTKLQFLMVDNMMFTGTIPSELGRLSDLIWLYLQYNSLTGGIPLELGQLVALEQLCLWFNSFTGTLPSWELLELSNLKWLFTDGNQISGTIPTELGLLTSLTKLGFRENLITGTMPTELGLLEHLDHFEIRNNEITGTIPSELSQLQNLLHKLNLNDNQLSGEIPSELGLLTRLWWLQLNNNPLHGAIPSEMSLMTSLYVLQLQDCDLSGEIPEGLYQLNGSEWDPYQIGLSRGHLPLTLNVSGNEKLAGAFPDKQCSDNSLHFDCSDLLCGCDCPCLGAGNATTSNHTLKTPVEPIR
ncbi:Leucine Rich Repeat [Seminavis robusta]|uniref:Leucine Rich Repeat n=1 Tax=Seminavis robusta TaxID=568900 RepID=A0A9N8HAD3_9STRA|nr:Leucine Rich Repeat [Seminavis robusta]|eukprot:Sro219_g090600.1 Leucine Rich Repeat (926) ;mRNA; f:83379-86832